MEDCGRTLEYWASRAIVHSNLGELFCRSVEDEILRDASGGVLACEVLKERLRVT